VALSTESGQLHTYVDDTHADPALQDELVREMLRLRALTIGRAYRERHGPTAAAAGRMLPACGPES
jgi:hypothetical protein